MWRNVPNWLCRKCEYENIKCRNCSKSVNKVLTGSRMKIMVFSATRRSSIIQHHECFIKSVNINFTKKLISLKLGVKDRVLKISNLFVIHAFSLRAAARYTVQNA